GLHGRISNLPAQNVLADGSWEEDSYIMHTQGKIREAAAVFGENICLTRKISARLGESRLKLEDTVENLGFERTPHMILYHINGGFPVVAEGSELICPVGSFQPRDEEAKVEMEKYNRFLPPIPGFKERVYYLDLEADKEGYTYVALVNKAFGNGEGIGFYLKYPKRQLPVLVEWKMNGEGCYVVGIEPANCRVEGRAKARESGELEFLEPGETRRYEMEIGVLASKQQIGQFEEMVREIKDD
ncbi:MAG: aldose 1-epimerase family protein, partial [Candidatus Latescibacteria bacterium]|nr:aldose 1-epimerase family protein [Candidatus Latescibacterota bacterium]